jgi:HlyD family secretion protein
MNDPSQQVVDTLGLEGAERRGRRWWPVVAAIAIVGLAAGAYALRQHRTTAPQFVTDSVRQGALLVTVTATGTLQPTNQVDVGSEVSGIIDRVLVDFNATVKAGQILAELDTQQLDARVASANAALAVAQASLMQAQATVTETAARAARSRDLASKNIASQQSLETDDAAAQRAVAAVASAKAQVTSAQASLKDAETARAKAAIRSPIDGMVIAREVDPGQTVAATFQTPVLFKVAEDLRRMELHLDIDESDIGQVHAGQHAEFRVDAYPGKSFEAEITSVRFNPRTVNNVVTYETVLSVANPDLLLRPGMTATADVLIAQKDNVLLVPNRALRFLPPEQAAEHASTQGAPRVWVERGGGPSPVAVTTGLTNGDVTEIEPGPLGSGARVIVDVVRAERQRTDNGPRPPFG